ncbi:MAG TPA: TolC family protein [Ignavibacteriaceae bacterium]|nr:TolC family protein [Ignavibacteriaceae bacterium]
MRTLISLLCVLLITAVSFGQGKSLTLDQAVNIALQKNTTLQRSMNNLDVAESGVKVAYGNFMPSLSANGGWNWNRSEDAGGYRNIGGSVLNFPAQTSESRSYNAGLNSSITLFDGLANFAQLSQSKDNLESSRLKLERVKQDIVFQTVSLYYAVITNDQLVKVNEENLKWNQRNLETITERNKLGAVTLADVYAQQVKTGNAELAVIQAKNNLETAKSNLLSYLNLDVLEKYSYVDPFGDASQNSMDFSKDYTNISDLVKQAMAARPDYKSAKLDLEASQSGITIARSGHFPTITGGASYSLNANQISKLQDSKTYSARLSINIPIFSGFRVSNQVQIAEVQEKNSALTVDDLERTIKQNIQKTYLDLQAAQKSLEVNKRNVASAEENRKIEESRYSLGSSTLLNVLIANSDLQTAKTNFINAQFQYAQLSEQLKYYLGVLDYKKFE